MAKPLTIEDWTIESVGQTQTVGNKGFQKRELVLTDNHPDYPQFRVIEAHKDNCSKLDGLSTGDKVKVDFWPSGRKWTDPNGNIKYFNTDKLASIQKAGHDWDKSTQVQSNIDLISGTESAYNAPTPF